jgi:hypothetical protein
MMRKEEGGGVVGEDSTGVGGLRKRALVAEEDPDAMQT